MKRHKPIRDVPPVERLNIELCRVVAHESSEHTFRKLASQLLRQAFNDGVNTCSTNDAGELTLTAYGSRLHKHTTLRRRAPRGSRP